MAIDLAAWSDENGADRAASLFASVFGNPAQGVWAAPGRVNLIGEHTDYNGGLCLPIALPHRTFAAVSPRPDDQVRIVSQLDPSTVWEGTLAGIGPGKVSGLAAYAGGPAWAMIENDYRISGFDAAVDSCVPLGSGLSSSAALECAIGVALDELFGLSLSADDAGLARLAQLCVLAENEVANAPTGGMDQAASLRTRTGHAMLLDCRDGSIEQLPFDLDGCGLVLLVMDTRAEHALVDGRYGARRKACEAAAATLDLPFLRDITDLQEALNRLDDPVVRQRVRHVVTEIARVREFESLLSSGRLREVGPVLDASHASLRDDYEVSCAELDLAVETATKAGALGARMTGGGFGGSAIALVEDGDAGTVAENVSAAFDAAGFTPPGFLVATAGPPAARVA